MRLSKRDRVIKYAKLKNFDANAITYISFLFDNCKSGVVANYLTSLHGVVAKELFSGNNNEYLSTYKFLQKERIIELKGFDLILLPWDEKHLCSLIYNVPRRKYSRSDLHDQQSIDKILSVPRYRGGELQGGPQDPDREDKELHVTFDWNKIIGIKVPRSFAKILTGRGLTDDVRNVLLPQDVIEKEESCQLSKEMLRYLFGLFSQCNSNGEIQDYNRHHSISRMLQLFEDNSCSIATFYDVHKKLLEKAIIEEGIHPKRRTPFLRLKGYKEGFGKGKNYVIIPYAVFKWAFKKLETASIKIFLDLIFKHNNGEDKNIKNTGKGKVIYFKAFKTKWDTDDSKLRYQETLNWLRKRCKAEVMDLLFGKVNKPALQQFFLLNLNNKHSKYGVVEVRIKEEYYVSKKAEKVREGIDPCERYKGKAGIIQEVLNNCSFEYSAKDKQDFVRVLRAANRRVIELMLRTLDIEYRTRKQKHWKGIKSLGAYLHWLYDEYKKGDRKLVYNKLLGDPEEIISDEYEESIDEFKEIYEEYEESM